MAGIGMGLLFVGYTAVLYGYILLKGYNIAFKELWSKNWPPTGHLASELKQGQSSELKP